MQKMTLKKVLPFILIIVVAGIFFGVLNVKKANAEIWCRYLGGGICTRFQNITECPSTPVAVSCTPTENEKKIADVTLKEDKDPQECGFMTILAGGMFSSACLLRASAGIAEWVIYTPGKLFIGIGGYAMDKSVNLSINSFATFANSDAVNKGWGLARDIVNLFLIFILLYIAIATILQLSGFNTKQLLTTLIVIAFLVNFSLVITKLIIDASNILALEFYKSFPQQTSGQTTYASLASTFANAFDADTIINSATTQQDKNVYLTKLLTFALGGIILFIAGFIFLVFGILFLVRLVVLIS